MKSFFIALMLLLVSTHIEAQSDECYNLLEFYPVDLYPTSQNLFSEDTPFIFSDTTVTIGSDIYTIKDIIPDTFINKRELVRLIGCIDDFEQFTDVVNGEYFQYILTEDYEPGHDRFILLKISDCGTDYTLIITMRGLYELDYIQDYDFDNERVLIVKNPERTSTRNLLVNTDTSQSIQIIKEPEYEIITEQVLLHDSYDKVEIIPAVYDSTFFTIENERSTCLEAEIIEKEFVYTYLSTPSVEYLVQDAAFELVTELVLLQKEHSGPSYLKREMKDSTLTILSPYQEINILASNDDCYGSYFLDCLGTETIEYPGRDTLIRNVIERCPYGYDDWIGLYCYALGDSPNIYKPRQFYKTISPSKIFEQNIQPQDKAILITEVLNKNLLPASCIDTEEIELFSLEQVSPEEIQITIVPAVYGTINYRKLITAGEIAVDTNLVDQTVVKAFEIHYPETEVIEQRRPIALKYEACTEKEIAVELVNQGYLQESQPLDRSAYYLAIAQFQKDNDLDIGAVDWSFIELLLF